MRKVILAVSVVGLCVSSVQAEPPLGRWWKSDSHGVIEAQIRNDGEGRDGIYLGCDHADGKYNSSSLIFTIGRSNPLPESIVLVKINHKLWKLNTEKNGAIQTDNLQDSNNFLALLRAMKVGKVMTVTLSTGRSAVFSLLGAKKILPPLRACKTEFMRPHANQSR